LYDVSDINVSNVSNCVIDGEAMMYQGLWGTGPFIRGSTTHLWGRSPPGPIAGCGPDTMASSRFRGIFRGGSGVRPFPQTCAD